MNCEGVVIYKEVISSRGWEIRGCEIPTSCVTLRHPAVLPPNIAISRVAPGTLFRVRVSTEVMSSNTSNHVPVEVGLQRSEVTKLDGKALYPSNFV